MQKKIIALAVAALASGAAFAQTSVVLGGNVDMGYSTMDQTTKIDGDKYDKTTNGFRGNDAANWSSSQITLSVTEDLGNGLKAGWFNAIGLNGFAGGDGVDEGYGANNYAFGRNRNAFVFVSGKAWGQVAVGYKDTVEGQLNGIGNAGSGNLNNIGRAFNSKIGYQDDIGTGVVTDTSRANVFEYASPVFSGFQALGQYGETSTEEDLTVSAAKTSVDTTYTFWSLGGKYSNGPLSLSAFYSSQEGDKDNSPVTNSSNETKDSWGLFANYDFKVAKVFASYANREIDGWMKDSLGAKVDNGNIEYDAWDIGVKVPFAQRFTFSGTYGQGDFSAKDKVSSAKWDADVEAYQLALTYDFSKRTSVTGYYASTEWDGKGNDSYEAEILGFGLRHQF